MAVDDTYKAATAPLDKIKAGSCCSPASKDDLDKYVGQPFELVLS